MKQALKVISLSLTLGGLALAQQAGPGPAAKVNEGKANITAGGTTITISEAHAKKLERIKEFGVTVFYPTFVPARFSLARVTLTKADFWAYHLRFCDRSHLCFTVEAADDGVGGSVGEFRDLKGNSALFGPFVVHVHKPWSEGNNTSRIFYDTEWLKESKANANKKHVRGAGQVVVGLYGFWGYGITGKEAVAIVESLAPIE